MVLVRDKGRDILDNGQGVGGLLLTWSVQPATFVEWMGCLLADFVSGVVNVCSFCTILGLFVGRSAGL